MKNFKLASLLSDKTLVIIAAIGVVLTAAIASLAITHRASALVFYTSGPYGGLADCRSSQTAFVNSGHIIVMYCYRGSNGLYYFDYR